MRIAIAGGSTFGTTSRQIGGVDIIYRTPERKAPKSQQTNFERKCATKVNMIYALGIIIEGLAADVGNEELRSAAEKLRAKVHEANNQVSDSFGNWADHVEEHIIELGSKNDLLPILCAKVYILSRKMEDQARSIDPNFDFYQREEVQTLKIFSELTEIDKKLYTKVSEVIQVCMNA